MINVMSKQSLRTSLAVFIAIIMQHYFSMSHEFWEPLAAFFMLQTPLTFNMRKVPQRYLAIVFALLASHSILMLSYSLFIVICMLLTALYYGMKVYSYHFKYLSPDLLFVAVVFLLVTPLSVNNSPFAHLHDVSLGALVAFLTGLFFFRPRPDVDFRKGVILIIEAYSNYLSSIVDLLLKKNNSENNVNAMKLVVEERLRKTQLNFPEWVYQAHFVPSLQQGHRHFLMKIEQLGQILFAMHYVTRNAIDPMLLNDLSDSLNSCVQDAKACMEGVLVRLDLKIQEDNLDVFYQDIVLLEKQINKIISLPLELLDVSKDYMAVSALLYDFKDIYKVILGLTEAIR
ncbi:MAG: hypothetical protein P4M12_03370 [Gammaproteobacteria bacterium]|nr:hypothetical protein [Gammaproteobacteria bacterium]